MKYKILIFPLFYLSYINGYDLSEYEAKYKFESNEISITGIREFKKKSGWLRNTLQCFKSYS